MNQLQVGNATLRLIHGDITHEAVDAIVNAANSSLMGGGGVDGAIHRAGGPAILEECRQIRRRQGRLPTGEAVITTAGNLAARHVVHTVGPVWRGGSNDEDQLLANAYRNSLALAAGNGCRSVAFPSISTGVYSFPIERAARIALRTLIAEMPSHDLHEVRMILFGDHDYRVYQAALAEVAPQADA